MGNKKVRRCICCKKILLDEKLPICLRCRLQGKEYAGNTTKAIGAVFMLLGAKAAIDNAKEKK